MSRKSQMRETVISRLSDYVLEFGLQQTSLRQLAEAADVSDRMLLYYFDNKADIITAVLMRVSQDLAMHLNAALPEDTPLSAVELFKIGFRDLAGPEFEPYMKISLEIAALAKRDVAPFPDIARMIIEHFVKWISVRLITEDPELREQQALTILALIDGFSIIAISRSHAELGTVTASLAEKLLGD